MSATKQRLIELSTNLHAFLHDFDDHIAHATIHHADLIGATLAAQKKAITFKTAVGAAVETYGGKIFKGANVENLSRSLDDHAEKRAIIAALEAGCKRQDLKALCLVYGTKINRLKEGEYAYPACGYCRQYIWENSHENLKVIVIDPDGVVTFSGPLKILYPLPYPATLMERVEVK